MVESGKNIEILESHNITLSGIMNTLLIQESDTIQIECKSGEIITKKAYNVTVNGKQHLDSYQLKATLKGNEFTFSVDSK